MNIAWHSSDRWHPTNGTTTGSATRNSDGIPPEDFLIRFPDHTSLQRALSGDRTVRTPNFTLFIKPWSRLANADLGVLSHTVQIELEGILLHAWGGTTVVDLVRTFA